MRKHRGGAVTLSPASVNDQTMFGPSNLASAQGQDYARIHQGQHGGALSSLAAAAPVGDQGLLDHSLRASAHLGPLDASIAAASGMRDQTGGRRRSKSIMKMLKNSYKSTRKSLSFKKLFKGTGKSKKKSLHRLLKNSYKSTKKSLSLKGLKKMLRMRGGAGYQYANQADYSAPGVLLPSDMQAKAEGQMNPEWGLSIKQFLPKM
jgi:hypothetical protein